MVWLPDGEFEGVFIRFERKYERGGRTDGHRYKAALAWHRTAKSNLCNAKFEYLGAKFWVIFLSNVPYLELPTPTCLR